MNLIATSASSRNNNVQKVERKHFNNWQLHFRTITADDSFAVAVAVAVAQHSAIAAVPAVIFRIVTIAIPTIVVIVVWIILARWQKDAMCHTAQHHVCAVVGR